MTSNMAASIFTGKEATSKVSETAITHKISETNSSFHVK